MHDLTDVGPGSIISAALLALMALLIGAYWPVFVTNPDFAALILRPPIIGMALVLAFMWSRLPSTNIERRLLMLFGIQYAALLVTTMAATHPGRALADWSKSLLLAFLAITVARALRDGLSSRWLGIALMVTSILVSSYIVLIYFQHMGLTIPTWRELRIYKGTMQREHIPLNTIAGTASMSFLLSACLVRMPRWTLVPVACFVFGCGGLLTGSRAPLALLFVGWFGVVLLGKLRSAKLLTRVASYGALFCVMAALAIGLSMATFRQVSRWTEGRWDLWSVAWEKFQEEPLVGSGFESWRDDLVSRLPGEYELTGTIEKYIAGGYHNEYLAMLAEHGLLGFLPTIALFWFVFSSSYRLAFSDWFTCKNGRWALLTAAILSLRAGIEMPGLFGYSQEPSDFLAFLFLAVVVSRHSLAEDLWRTEASVVETGGFEAAPRVSEFV